MPSASLQVISDRLGDRNRAATSTSSANNAPNPQRGMTGTACETVSVNWLEVVLPKESVTTTQYVPASPLEVAGIVYEALVAWEIGVPFLNH